MGTNSLKLVCKVVFLVRAPQSSDLTRNKRSQVSKGKIYVDNDVTVKSNDTCMIFYDTVETLLKLCFVEGLGPLSVTFTCWKLVFLYSLIRGFEHR